MRYTNIVDLIARVETTDEIGNLVYSETSKKVYAIEKKVGITEFYNATAVGLTLGAELQIKKSSYNGETEAEYKGERYAIVRTTPFNHQDLIIVLGRKQGVND